MVSLPSSVLQRYIVWNFPNLNTSLRNLSIFPAHFPWALFLSDFPLFSMAWIWIFHIINKSFHSFNLGFPGISDGKEPACNAGDLGSIPESGRLPWKRERQPTPVYLPGDSHGQTSPASYSPWGRKELGTTERLSLPQFLKFYAGYLFWIVQSFPSGFHNSQNFFVVLLTFSL